MNNEDKQLIAEYMGWDARYLNGVDLKYLKTDSEVEIDFDSNDASLCVKRMVEKGEWDDFMTKSKTAQISYHIADNIAWLFNADNFFTCMAAWLKERER